MKGKPPAPFVTLAWIPHGAETVRAVRLPRAVWRALTLFLAFAFLALPALGRSYWAALSRHKELQLQLARRQQEYRQLSLQLAANDQEMRSLAARLEALEQQLQRLAAANSELRRALADAPSGRTPPLPSGGPVSAATWGQGLFPAPRLASPSPPVPTARLRTRLAAVEGELERQRRELAELRQRVARFLDRQARTPAIWPAAGWLSSLFGPRRHPVTGQYEFHWGVDVAAAMGAPVVATAQGVVTLAGRLGSYGLTVVVDHGYGLRTLYAHLSRIRVRPGQWVARGEVLGMVGSTGLSTGPHVHYEVHREGRPVDPLPFLP